MSILEWIRAGCAGSYGTVIEPCNYTEKFPHARVHYWYARGFNLAESYVMAVDSPYQGLTVGDPLCAPYARPPDVQVSGLSTGAVVSGTVGLNVSAAAPDGDRRVTRIDLFFDDQWLSTLYDTGPTPGNMVTATVDGKSKSYTVQSGDDLSDVVQGLADAMNALAPPSQRLDVTAAASTDRIELRQRDADLGQSDTRAYSVERRPGRRRRFDDQRMDRQRADARDGLRRHPRTESRGDAAGRRHAPVDHHPHRQHARDQLRDGRSRQHPRDPDERPRLRGQQRPRSPGCRGMPDEVRGPFHLEPGERGLSRGPHGRLGKLQHRGRVHRRQVAGSGLVNTSFSANFDSNADVLGSRGAIFLAAGEAGPNASYNLTTTALPDGPHTLRVVAYEGTAVATQGHAVIPFVVDNHEAECTVDAPADLSRWVHGESISVNANATSDVAITQMILYAEGKTVATSAVDTVGATLDTLDYGVGALPLQCLAVDALGRAVVSEVVFVEILPDYDNDTLDDDWELEHYATIEMYGAGDDPDHDGADMEAEFRADTDPLEPESLFAIQFDFVAPDDTPACVSPQARDACSRSSTTTSG